MATIRGRLLFEVQTSQLLFISALPQCGDYSRAATIRSADVAATIYFSSTAMWRLFEGGYYSKCRRRGYYLFQLYRNVATIRGRLLFEVQTSRLLFISALPQCGEYSRVAIRGWLLFEVQTSRLLFISALPQCGDYSRAATIRSADVAATIYFSSTAMWRLFKGGYYSKYRRRGYYLFQLYRNAATIRGRLLFEVQTSRLLFISALPQCGDYLRVATIRGAVFIRGNTVKGLWKKINGFTVNNIHITSFSMIYCKSLIYSGPFIQTNFAYGSSHNYWDAFLSRAHNWRHVHDPAFTVSGKNVVSMVQRGETALPSRS